MSKFKFYSGRKQKCPNLDQHSSMDPDSLPLELLLNGGNLDLTRGRAGFEADGGGHPGRLPRHRASHHVAHGRVRRLLIEIRSYVKL